MTPGHSHWGSPAPAAELCNKIWRPPRPGWAWSWCLRRRRPSPLWRASTGHISPGTRKRQKHLSWERRKEKYASDKEIHPMKPRGDSLRGHVTGSLETYFLLLTSPYIPQLTLTFVNPWLISISKLLVLKWKKIIRCRFSPFSWYFPCDQTTSRGYTGVDGKSVMQSSLWRIGGVGLHRRSSWG